MSDFGRKLFGSTGRGTKGERERWAEGEHEGGRDGGRNKSTGLKCTIAMQPETNEFPMLYQNQLYVLQDHGLAEFMRKSRRY